ncbi:TetR/AcrR family transcriptional regulator [Saccharibacillus sp. CPCC 101409]|uniref:TetR/AcrR family transcriptional regulator n=1 Tax=Saccharibacillus sp. CPCC 101409 TaxID=3058041 RepID=UPI0026720095|nr:TetR/AcrR family transcriptional regulator [Saccharibacillus sp. CPCC 101409]MDO3413008.1 TetR/AcrR family transcriptional regulator [Saccharibacillus sp. CPCC 101409]
MVKVDRRIRKSREAIKRAVIELMNEQEFDQITIQDISERADVSRKTIYLHYLDKFDLLDKLIEEHIDDLRKICDSTDDAADYREAGVLWFEYFERHSLFFSALLASKGSLFFRNRFLEFFLRELEKGKRSSQQSGRDAADGVDIDIQFLGAAIVGIVEWWFKNGKPYSPDFMAMRLGTLLDRNLEAILSPV